MGVQDASCASPRHGRQVRKSGAGAAAEKETAANYADGVNLFMTIYGEVAGDSYFVNTSFKIGDRNTN